MELIVNDTIVLKTVSIENSEEIFRLIDTNRAHLREWMPWVDGTKDRKDVDTWVEKALKQQEENKGFHCGIRYERQPVGIIGFHGMDWVNKHTSLGYWLSEVYEGRGIMTACVRFLVSYAFSELKLHRVVIRSAVGNEKSKAIPERLGFTQEGKLREEEWMYDHFKDLIVFSILEQEWKKKQDEKAF